MTVKNTARDAMRLRWAAFALFALICSCGGGAYSPVDVSWVRHTGGPKSAYANKLAEGPTDSLTVFGYHLGVWFGEGEDNEVFLPAQFEQSAFLARYTTDGEFVWAKGIGSNEGWFGLYFSQMSALPDGSLVAGGIFKGQATFGEDSDGNAVTLTPVVWQAGSLDTYSDGFVALYDPNGTVQWVATAGGEDYDDCDGVVALSDNSTIAAGRFLDSATFGRGGPGETTLTAIEPSSNGDIFLARYNPNGNMAWVVQAGGPGEDSVSGLAKANDETFLLYGRFGDGAVFGRGEANETILHRDDDDVFTTFVAKYRVDGSLVWAREVFKSIRGSTPLDLAVLSDGSFLLAGLFDEPSVTIGVGDPNETTLEAERNNDTFIARFNPQGELEWVISPEERPIYQPGEDEDGFVSPHDLAVGPDDSFYMTGTLGGEVTFGRGEANETKLSPLGGWDGYLAYYEHDGRLTWATRFGVRDYGFPLDSGDGVTVLEDGSIVVAGSFGEGGRLTIGDGVKLGLVSASIGDMLLMRLSPRQR